MTGGRVQQRLGNKIEVLDLHGGTFERCWRIVGSKDDVCEGDTVDWSHDARKNVAAVRHRAGTTVGLRICRALAKARK